MLRAEGLSFKVGPKYLLHETSAEFEEGRFHVIMGANGAGKSTLLKLLAGDLKPSSGKVLLEGKALDLYSKKTLATKRAVLSQHYHISFPITVNDIVLMGRYPFFLTHPAAKDIAICEEAMQLMNVAQMKERDYGTLSGGEAQKVQMSRVLAQIWEAREGERRVLFLDEPVSHLDVKYQQQLLQAARELCRQHTTVIAILHDMNLAIAFADRLLLMKEGRMVYDLMHLAEITTEMIREVFDVPSTILHPERHKPVVIF